MLNLAKFIFSINVQRELTNNGPKNKPGLTDEGDETGKKIPSSWGNRCWEKTVGKWGKNGSWQLPAAIRSAKRRSEIEQGALQYSSAQPALYFYVVHLFSQTASILGNNGCKTFLFPKKERQLIISTLSVYDLCGPDTLRLARFLYCFQQDGDKKLWDWLYICFCGQSAKCKC